jgi:hypothetical protein
MCVCARARVCACDCARVRLCVRAGARACSCVCVRARVCIHLLFWIIKLNKYIVRLG